MTNKQLLALAAKAHGDLVYIPDTDRYYELPRKYYTPPWLPLDDDGDAMRLAAKLRIDIVFYTRHVYVSFTSAYRIDVDYGQDRLKATRLAVLSVAAQIGERME